MADLDVGQRRGGPVRQLAAGLERGAAGGATGRVPRARRVQPLGVDAGDLRLPGGGGPEVAGGGAGRVPVLRAVRRGGSRSTAWRRRFVSAALRGGGRPVARRGLANGAALRRPGPLLGRAERRGGGRRRALLPGDGGRRAGLVERPRPPHAGHPGPAAGPVRPRRPGRRLGAQHARRRRAGHRHGRRRDGQHWPAGPGAARRGRGGPGRLRQLPGHGDRRAPLGFAAGGDGGAPGSGGLDRAASCTS